jgi:hypothetical protein
MDFLNKDYEGRRIGISRRMVLPAGSPDLQPLDFFLWDCMKARVITVLSRKQDIS